MGRFGNVLTAMTTPFKDDGGLDLDGAQKLAKWLIANGNDGLVIAGTTGESATLTHGEQTELITAVCEAVDAPVVAGAGSNDTVAAVELTEGATKAGAAAILQVTPYYNRPSQAGLLYHFKACAEATDLPVMLYDIPARSGRKIETDTLLELAHDVDNVVALKDAAGNPGETAVFLSQAPDGFEVYSGDDGMTLPLLAVGAVGVVGVATAWTGAEHQELFAAWNAGDIAKAQSINASLLESFAFESQDIAPNPIPTKALLRLLGLPAGPGRSPMNIVPPELEAMARTVVAGTKVGRDHGIAL